MLTFDPFTTEILNDFNKSPGLKNEKLPFFTHSNPDAVGPHLSSMGYQ